MSDYPFYKTSIRPLAVNKKRSFLFFENWILHDIAKILTVSTF
jgi:hypothetical protein